MVTNPSQHEEATYPMRKFVYSLLCALLLTSSLVAPALAQDSPFAPPVICGDLDAADCSILEDSAAAMQGVTAYAFDIEYKTFVTGLPEMEIESVEITFGATGMMEIDPDVVAAMQELTAASMSGDADTVAAAMEEMTAILLDFYAGVNFDGEVYFSVPEELAAILSEDSDVPMPPDLTFAFRIIDGMFYMQISEFKEFAPDLEEFPADWIGFDLVGLMEQSMAQSEGGEFDAESMTAGLVGTALAYQLIDAMEPFVTVERLDDADLDGQSGAVFHSSVDMVEFFSSDAFAAFVRDGAAAIGADDAETTAQLDEGLTMAGFLAPMIFGGMEIDNQVTIGVDDLYQYGQDFVFRWDLSQLLGFAAMSDPSIAEALGDAEPLIEFMLTAAYDQFGAEFEFAAPDDVQIIPLDEMSPDGVDAVF
jgi:hypothetical protein